MPYLYFLTYNTNTMKKITAKAVTAFLECRNFQGANTSVQNEAGETRLYLHGNLIALMKPDGLYVTNAGWPTVTTRERLNGLPNVRVSQRKGVQYLNGKEWDGSLTKIQL